MSSQEIMTAWIRTPLKRIARVRYGKARPKSDGLVPVVGSGGVFHHAGEALTEGPTLVVGRKGTAGKVWYFSEPCWPSDTTFYLEWLENVNPEFVFAALLANPLSGDESKTTLPSLKSSDLEGLEIPLPPLDEQRTIAHVLRTVQRAKEQTNQVLEASLGVKKSLLRDLIARPDALMEVSTENETRVISDIAEVRTSTTPLSKVSHGGHGACRRILYLKVSDLSKAASGGYVKNAATEIDVPESELPRLKLVPPDSVVFPKRGAAISTNRKARMAQYTMLDPNLIAVIPKKVDSGYLYRWFEAFNLRSLLDAAVLPQINKKDIAPLRISLPSRRVQSRVARVLDRCDDKIRAEIGSLAALDELFKALLHELMIGRARVKDFEEVI